MDNDETSCSILDKTPDYLNHKLFLGPMFTPEIYLKGAESQMHTHNHKITPHTQTTLGCPEIHHVDKGTVDQGKEKDISRIKNDEQGRSATIH